MNTAVITTTTAVRTASTGIGRTAPFSLRRRVLPLLAALMLALMLTVGAGTATRVAAQPVGSGIDGVSQACRGLQDHASDLAAEYSRIGRENPNDPRLDDILAELRSTGTTWQQIGCQGAFGNILGAQMISAPRNGNSNPRAGDVGVFTGVNSRKVSNG